LVLVAILLFFAGVLALTTGFYHSPPFTGESRRIVQPILFSHQHHVQGLGLDCRYCHTNVERSSFAGLPDSATCYGCHSQIWNTSEMLKPVRDSLHEQKPLQWYRVNQLPDYVYFSHQIHIAKGIGCFECHGAVSRMPVVEQKRSFLMRDCLSCHKDPGKFVRPRREITNENWRPEDHPDENLKAIKELQVHPLPVTDCNLCHR
jgi:hypothetical protein